MPFIRICVRFTMMLVLFAGGCSSLRTAELLRPRHAGARKEVKEILKKAEYNRDVIRYIRKHIVPLPSGQGGLVDLARLAGTANRNYPELMLVAEYMIIEEASSKCDMFSLAGQLVESQSNDHANTIIDSIMKLRASTTYPTVKEAVNTRKAT